MSKLRITWVKSGIGYSEDQRRTIRALGLRRLNQVVEHDDSASIRGMVTKVKHLVQTEVVDNGTV
jgi:large subunit ribosomal protein L30